MFAKKKTTNKDLMEPSLYSAMKNYVVLNSNQHYSAGG